MRGLAERRVPTPEERALESPIAWTALADTFVFLLRIPLIFTGSLTMLSDAIRSVFTFGGSLIGFFIMRAIHRGRMSRYEFGVGRIEDCVTAIAGLGLIVSGAWVAQSAIATLFAPERPVSPLGLAGAVVFNAVKLTVNVAGLYGLMLAERGGSTALLQVQIRARWAMVITALILQVTLTIAALARDPAVAMGLDAAGAVFIGAVMLWHGLPMVARALPAVLGAPAVPGTVARVRRAAEQVLADGEVGAIRTRRDGPGVLAEIELRAGASGPVAGLGPAASPDATIAAGAPIIEWIDCSRLMVDVPVSDAELPLIRAGAEAEVVLEGEPQTRGATVLMTRGSSATLGRTDLAALAKGRTEGVAQVVLTLDAEPAEFRRCPVGGAAFAEFPGVGLIDVLRARLRL